MGNKKLEDITVKEMIEHPEMFNVVRATPEQLEYELSLIKN